MKEPVSLYIHIPYCFSKCRYCDFFSMPFNSTVPDSYIKALLKELSYRQKLYDFTLLKSIYIGGGTPSLLKFLQIDYLLSEINKLFDFKSDCEITLEVNPDDISEEFLVNLSKTKVNRLSCGIQSLNDKALKFAGRRADREVNLKALDLIKKFWKKNTSFDLICALPFETEASFGEAVKTLVDFNPDHISMYSLTFEDETPFGKMLKSSSLEYDFDFADRLWLENKEFLEKKGYVQYEISNFCKNNKCSFHNLTYWNHENYLGIGSGGTGSFYLSDGSCERWTNSLKVSDYISFWTEKVFDKNKIPEMVEKVSVSDSKFEFFMMGLRKAEGISLNQYEKDFKEELSPSFINLAQQWSEKDLALFYKKEGSQFFKLNNKGLLFLNRFLEELEL